MAVDLPAMSFHLARTSVAPPLVVSHQIPIESKTETDSINANYAITTLLQSLC